MVIDFHSHILPAIDDGSRNLDTSIQMLHMCAEHGVMAMVATPHFYADRERVEDFLDKRARAYDEVMQKHDSEMPDIIPGAEVAFFQGISKADKVDKLVIGQTNLMLLEMPFVTWNASVIREVRTLIEERGFCVIVAHLERFLKISGNKPWVEKLLELPVYIQINAEGLLDWRQRGSLVKMFQQKKAHLLGSDCHGLHHRTPNLWEGRAVLEKKLGPGILRQIDDQGSRLLSHNI